MTKFIKPASKTIVTEETAAAEAATITGTRCGGCAYFISKLDANNPFDGFCHAYPPTGIPTGFRWAKTASNEFGCSIFKKRG